MTNPIQQSQQPDRSFVANQWLPYGGLSSNIRRSYWKLCSSVAEKIVAWADFQLLFL